VSIGEHDRSGQWVIRRDEKKRYFTMKDMKSMKGKKKNSSRPLALKNGASLENSEQPEKNIF